MAGAAETGAPAVPASRRVPALRTLDAFSSPAFRLLWLNTLSFSLVQGIQRFAFVWLVIDELGQPASWGGLITFALGIPAMFLMLPAGVLSDRASRRALLIWTQSLSLAVIAGGTALMFAGVMTPGLALLVAVGSGATAALGMPVRTAVLPALVERDRLMNAIVMSTVGQNVMMIGGPIAAGAAIGLWGIGAGFALQSVAYAVGLLALLPLTIPEAARPAVSRRPLRELVEGFEFVLRSREMKALIVTLMASGLFMLGPVFALVPPIVRDEMGRGASAGGTLFGIMAVGMLATSLVLASVGDFRNKGAWFILNLAVGGIDVALMGVVDSFGLLCVLMFVWGMGGGVFINLNRTLIQANTPDALMGRVMSIQSLGMVGFSPLGGLLAGVAAEPMGATAFLVAAGAALTAVALVIFATQPGLRRMS
ncbi:MAG TPA: MFS transporter [Dehalococcoidia bacterium]|nr:MFS transporter [Dehalococcoidia bacterium]